MPTPTVPVTVTLISQDGTPYVGAVVSAVLDGNEVYEGIIFADRQDAMTDAAGVAVLNLFPNAPSPSGLGTQGTTYRVFASFRGARPLDVKARVPNAACRLEDILVDTDAVPLSAAETAALNAQSSASAAATSASQAATSATNAAGSAASALDSKNAAAASATSASNDAASAAASFDSFDDRYLGAKAADPAVDNDGNALLVGAIYWNSTIGVFKVYQGGGAWSQFASPPDGSVTTAKLATGIAPVVSSLNGGQLAGLRNKIINGDCRVTQRGTVALAANTLTFGGADRHPVYVQCATLTAGSVFSGLLGVFSSGRAQQVGGLSGTGVLSVNAYHRIESRDSAHLSGKTITVSAKVFHNTGLGDVTCNIVIAKPNSADNYSAATTLANVNAGNIANSSVVPVSATFTIAPGDADNGIQIQISLAHSAATITTKDYAVGDIQLEVGSVATPFETRPYGLELSHCARYYCVYSDIHVSMSAGSAGYIAQVTYPLLTQMRVAPTMTASWTQVSNASAQSVAGRQTSMLISATGSVAGAMALTANITADAEI